VVAKALLADPEISMEEVAARLKISPATLYRYLPGGRSSL
jgi:AcrR family transcriptional regulator